MKKQTWVEKIVAFLQGGDEAKLARFQSKVTKHLKKQIAMREDEIESLRDRITDAKDTLADRVLNVNVERISNTDAVEDYSSVYVQQVIDTLATIEELEDDIQDLQDEIDVLKKASVAIFGEAE